jgi:hypothetical protein
MGWIPRSVTHPKGEEREAIRGTGDARSAAR